MKDLRQAVGEADLVLHATDALFDPPIRTTLCVIE
jgi:hypothetical protein